MILNIINRPQGISDDDIVDAFFAVREEYPREMCGVFTKSKGFIKLTNIADNPENDFLIRESARITANCDDVIAIVHSHPDESCSPSERDMVSQLATCKPWGIISYNDGKFNTQFWVTEE